MTASPAVKPLMPRLPSAGSRRARRSVDACDRLRAPRTRKIGSRLVKKLPGPMTTASKRAIAAATAGWIAAGGSSQSCERAWPSGCPRRLPPPRACRSRRRIPRRWSRRSRLIGHTWPRQPRSARRPSTAARKSPLYCSIIDSSRLPPVWPARRACSSVGSRASRIVPRFALVARQRERALQHVAGRQHAQLVAQLSRTAAAVEHRDDGVEVEPGIGLQPAEQARQARAAAEAADVQLTKTHDRIF